MSAEHKKLALQALQNIKGDDLYRARNAFKNYTLKELGEQHGASGKTRMQILDEYEAHETRVNAAIKWLEGMK